MELKKVWDARFLYSFEKMKEITNEMTNILYFIIYGERKNGKSYQGKMFLLEEAFFLKKKFTIIFRSKEDRKTNSELSEYFDDMHIEKLTKGKYQGVKIKAGGVYWTTVDDKGKEHYAEQCGYVAFVNQEARVHKSQPFEGCFNILFEEFITNGKYLPDEVLHFESLVNSILRHRIFEAKRKNDPKMQCHIIMIGNTISQVNPYVLEWGLSCMMGDNQKPGTIQKYEREDSSGVNKIGIAIERCKPLPKWMNGGLAISRKAQQHEVGDWETGDFPVLGDEIEEDTEQHLIVKYNDEKIVNGFKQIREKHRIYDVYHTFIFAYMGMKFRCRFMIERYNQTNMFIYVERKTTPIKPNTRVIGDIYDTSVLYTKNFKPLVQREAVVFDLLNEGKVIFDTTLTGTNFYTCMNTMK